MLVLTDEDTLITREQLDRGFKERMKEQERQAVRALVTANNIKGGFEGKAADAAETYLTQTLQTPTLQSPIKN